MQMTYYATTNSVYLFGGNNGVTDLNTIYKWDISQNIWFQSISTTIQAPSFRSYANNVVTINNIAYFIGVHDGVYNSGIIYAFNMDDESWIDNSNFAAPPHPAVYGCLSTNGTSIFMVGGWEESWQEIDYLQIYHISSNTWIKQQINIPIIQSKGWQGQYCTMIDNSLFVFGGMVDGSSIDGVYKYNHINSQWTQITNLPVITRDGINVFQTPYIYVIGGWYNNINSIFIFDVESEQIIDESYLMVGGAYTAASVINNEIYIFGGGNTTSHTAMSSVQICSLYPTQSPTLYPTSSPTTYNPTSYPTTYPTTYNPTTYPTTYDPTTYNPTTYHPTYHPTTSDPTTSNPTTYQQTTYHPTTYHPTTAIPTNRPITYDQLAVTEHTPQPTYAEKGIDAVNTVDTTVYLTEPNDEKNSNGPTILIIMACIVAVLLICLIFIVVILVRKKRNRHKNHLKPAVRNDIELQKMASFSSTQTDLQSNTKTITEITSITPMGNDGENRLYMNTENIINAENTIKGELQTNVEGDDDSSSDSDIYQDTVTNGHTKGRDDNTNGHTEGHTKRQ